MDELAELIASIIRGAIVGGGIVSVVALGGIAWYLGAFDGLKRKKRNK